MNTEQTALQMIAGAARCPEYDPAMVKGLMKKLDMNEKAFALLMNVSPSTVRLWTTGAALPAARQGVSCRFMKPSRKSSERSSGTTNRQKGRRRNEAGTFTANLSC